MIDSASNSINAMRLRDLYDRVDICKERYWNISKDERIRYGLRSEVYGPMGYSGMRVIEMCTDLLSKAFRGIYSFQSESLQVYVEFGKEKLFESAEEIVELVNQKTVELEGKLDHYATVISAQ